MGYHIDLGNIGIDQYKKILRTSHLIPSWKILENNIDENLDNIKKCGIPDLGELLIALKDKVKIQEFSKKSGLPENYLTVLKRMVKGFQPKPNRIMDFPCIPEAIARKLEKIGVKNTLKLYGNVLTPMARKQLSQKTGIDDTDMMRLTQLTDLSRIRWVNHTFAHVLLESGYDTAEKVAKADYLELYGKVKKRNKERQIYRAHIGANDMKMCIEAAKGLDFEIEY